MALEMYDEDDADLGIIQNRRVAIFGFDSAARAHAYNLRESGVEIVVSLDTDAGDDETKLRVQRAEEDGFPVLGYAAAADWADVVMLLLPAAEHRGVYDDFLAPHLDAEDALLVAHGTTLHFGQIKPTETTTVALVAPQASGERLRAQFENGKGVPCLVAVGQDPRGEGESIALSFAAALGCARAGIIRTTFEEESVTALFGQQAVLDGGLNELVISAFNTLVDAGHSPELAYFACVNKLRAAAEKLTAVGVKEARKRSANIAEYGGYVAGPRIVSDDAGKKMRETLDEIEDGTFTQSFFGDAHGGGEELDKLRDKTGGEKLDDAGCNARALMSWMPVEPED